MSLCACGCPVCTALGTHLDAGLGAQRAHQAVQRVEAQLDVEASLLLGRDVRDAAALHLWVSAVRHILAAGTALRHQPHQDGLAQRLQLGGGQQERGVHMEIVVPSIAKAVLAPAVPCWSQACPDRTHGGARRCQCPALQWILGKPGQAWASHCLEKEK